MVSEAWERLAQERITLQLIDLKEQDRWNRLIRKHHYLKEHRMVGETLRYVAKLNGRWIALLGWSSAAYHLRARDAWIGWNDAQRQAARHLLACNARFVMLPGKHRRPELASQILSLNLERLSEDWLHCYDHPLALAETYVDPQRFEGTCYRAANWIEVGLSKGFGRSRLDFYQLHQQPKAIFLYPLVRNARQILSAPSMPANWAQYRREPQPQDYPLTLLQTKSLLSALEQLKDPRRYRGWRHRNVGSILAISVAAMIAGNDTLLGIGEFSQHLNQNELRRLHASRCPQTRKYLAPSETTIRRILQRLEPTKLDRIVDGWLRSHLPEQPLRFVAVDGKCVRTASKMKDQPIQLFSALDAQHHLVCRQMQIPCKTNEIPCLKELLQQLDLRGALVTADALHTQKETAAHLVEQKQADYLLVVKCNQPKLFDRLAACLDAPGGVFFPSAVPNGPSSRTACDAGGVSF